MTGTNRNIYGIHPDPQKDYVAGVIMWAVFLVFFTGITLSAPIHSSADIWVGAGVCGLVALVALAVCIRRGTIVNVPARSITRESRLFDRLLVWRRRYSFSDFDAVTIRYALLGTEAAGFFIVSLKRRSGKALRVRLIGEYVIGASRQADELARRLSDDLQLPVVVNTEKAGDDRRLP